MKKSLLLALVVGVVLSIGAPALAKGVDQVTISDGDQEMTVSVSDSENGPMDPIVEDARFFDGLWIESAGQRLPGRPSGPLGEAITLAWRFPALGTEIAESTVVQLVYLDAAGGPVAYVAGGQTFYGDVTAESWFPVAPELRQTLTDIGFGMTAAAPRITGGEAQGKAATDDSSTWLWLVVGLGGLAVIAVLVQSGALRRRTQRMA